jgi:DNA-directed RNA polymerase specialized sigma subunit, sigma24 homolog
VFDNTSKYKIWQKKTDGVISYHISFLDVSGIHHEAEVSREVYQEFGRFHRIERNLRRSDERHEEYFPLADEEINRRAVAHQKSVEEIVCDRLLGENIQDAIAALPETQRRRFLLHYQYGLTYKQIADLESCSPSAIQHSMKAAKENFVKNFRI